MAYILNVFDRQSNYSNMSIHRNKPTYPSFRDAHEVNNWLIVVEGGRKYSLKEFDSVESAIRFAVERFPNDVEYRKKQKDEFEVYIHE